jgi:hypothetical protein
LESVRGGVRPFVEWVEQSRRPTADEATDLLARFAIPVFLLEQLWNAAREMIDRAVEHGKLVGVLRELAGLTDACIRAFSEVRSLPTALEFGSQTATELDAALKRLVEIRSDVARLLQWLETPPPPIDVSKLPAASRERTAAGYISRDELAARLGVSRPR